MKRPSAEMARYIADLVYEKMADTQRGPLEPSIELAKVYAQLALAEAIEDAMKIGGAIKPLKVSHD